MSPTVKPWSGRENTRTVSPAPTSPACTIRRYVPGRCARVNRCGKRGSSMRRPSFQHGRRGSLTSSTAVPTVHLSPTTDAARSRPCTVQVLAEATRTDGSAELPFPPIGVFGGVCVHGLVVTTVHASVRLLVAFEVHAPGAHAA